MSFLSRVVPENIIETTKNVINYNKNVIFVSACATLGLYLIGVVGFINHYNISFMDFTGTPLYVTFFVFSFIFIIFFSTIIFISTEYCKTFRTELADKSPYVTLMINNYKADDFNKILNIPDFYRLYFKSAWPSLVPVSFIFFLFQTSLKLEIKLFSVVMVLIFFSSLFSVQKKLISTLVTVYNGIFFLGFFLWIYEDYPSSIYLLYTTSLSLSISFTLSIVSSFFLVMNTVYPDKQLAVTISVMAASLMFVAKSILTICIFYLGLGGMKAAQIIEMNTEKEVFSGFLILYGERKIFVCKGKEKKNISSFDAKNHFVRFKNE